MAKGQAKTHQPVKTAQKNPPLHFQRMHSPFPVPVPGIKAQLQDFEVAARIPLPADAALVYFPENYPTNKALAVGFESKGHTWFLRPDQYVFRPVGKHGGQGSHDKPSPKQPERAVSTSRQDSQQPSPPETHNTERSTETKPAQEPAPKTETDQVPSETPSSDNATQTQPGKTPEAPAESEPTPSARTGMTIGDIRSFEDVGKVLSGANTAGDIGRVVEEQLDQGQRGVKILQGEVEQWFEQQGDGMTAVLAATAASTLLGALNLSMEHARTSVAITHLGEESGTAGHVTLGDAFTAVSALPAGRIAKMAGLGKLKALKGGLKRTGQGGLGLKGTGVGGGGAGDLVGLGSLGKSSATNKVVALGKLADLAKRGLTGKALQGELRGLVGSGVLVKTTTSSFRRALVRALRAAPKGHPLKALLNKKGNLLKTKGLAHSELINDPRLIQMGHAVSDKSGLPTPIVIQSAWGNQFNNITVEGIKGADAFVGNALVVVDVNGTGILMEVSTARDLLGREIADALPRIFFQL